MIRAWFNPIFCPRRFTEAHLGRQRGKSTAWPCGSNCLLQGVRLKLLKSYSIPTCKLSVSSSCDLILRKISIAIKENQKLITYLKQQHLKIPAKSNNVSVVFVFFKHGTPAISYISDNTGKVLHQFE